MYSAAPPNPLILRIALTPEVRRSLAIGAINRLTDTAQLKKSKRCRKQITGGCGASGASGLQVADDAKRVKRKGSFAQMSFSFCDTCDEPGSCSFREDSIPCSSSSLLELESRSFSCYPQFECLNAPEIPTQYCFSCHPTPLEVLDVNYAPDPLPTCLHQASETDFLRMLISRDSLSIEGTLLADLLVANQTIPIGVLADIYDIFFCYSWLHMVRTVPTRPPTPFNDALQLTSTVPAPHDAFFFGSPFSFNLQATSARGVAYQQLNRHSFPMLLPSLVRYVCNVHGFSPSEGYYKDLTYRAPTPFNWYPAYAPAHYTNYRYRAYESLPVNPRVRSLTDLLLYERSASSAERADMLAESRLSVSDAELKTRLLDIKGLVDVFTRYPSNNDEDASSFFEDLKALHQRYLDELGARQNHQTSFTVASLIFVRSRDCATVLGLVAEQLPISQQFALAYAAIQATPGAIIGTRIHAPVPPTAVKFMETDIFDVIISVPVEMRWQTKLQLLENFSELEPIFAQPSLCCALLTGNCTPAAIWASVHKRAPEKLCNVGFMLRLWCLART
jgi:hypothetical protein